MKVYIVSVCRGDWDDVSSFDIGVYSTLEKAERIKEKWFESIEQYLWKNPLPITQEEIEKLSDGDELEEGREELYNNWLYRENMSTVLENQRAAVSIKEVELDLEDFNILE